MNNNETMNTNPNSAIETAPKAGEKASAESIVQKGGMLRALYERGAAGFARLFNSGKKLNERASSSLYQAADPKNQGLENMPMTEIVGNMGSAASQAIESGANAAASKMDRVINPAGKDYMEMPMSEILGNMAAPAVEKANAIANKMHEVFNPGNKDFEQMSMAEMFANVKEFVVGKKEKRAAITAERSALETKAAALEASPNASALEIMKNDVAGIWNKLVGYGKGAYEAVRSIGATERAQYKMTVMKWKAFTLEQDIQKYGVELEETKKKIAQMEGFEQRVQMLAMPVAEKGAEAAAA